jgi:MFS family permease
MALRRAVSDGDPPSQPAPSLADERTPRGRSQMRLGWKQRRPPRTPDGFRFTPFRWYMVATTTFDAALSMQQLVRGYLAFQLTGSFAALGLVSLGQAVPMLLFSPVGGLLADRWSQRAVIQLGQVASVAASVVLAALLFADALTFWHLVVASVVQGLTFALMMPSRQAILADVVGMDRLMTAVPLQTAALNLTQILAPAAGGFMIDWFGVGWVYVAMAAMYALSVIVFFRVVLLDVAGVVPAAAGGVVDGWAGSSGAPDEQGRIAQLLSGFRYLGRDATMGTIMLFVLIAALLGMPVRMLLPGLAADVFGDDGATLGLLQMGMGIGALIGSLGLVGLRISRHRGWALAAATALLGAAQVALAFAGMFLVALACMLFVGIGWAGRQSLGAILMHAYVQDEYRGRVMAIFMMQLSLMWVGTFGVSLFMEVVGPQVAIGSLGVTLVVATLAYLVFVPTFRRLR